MSITLHVDGGARGNPGPAGAGVVLRGPDGRSILEAGYWLGRMTNNQAEYRALILGLTAALETGAKTIRAFGDSELIVKQVLGQYRVKAGPLKDLHGEVMALLDRFESWHLQHVRREANSRADELVNLALDSGTDVIDIDARSGGRPVAPLSVPVELRMTVLEAGTEGACPAVMPSGTVLVVGGQLPAMCIHAADATLRTLLEMRRHGRGACDLRCGQVGCGARFRLEADA